MTIYTHEGIFHSDDTFAVAVIKSLSEARGFDVKVERVRELPGELDDCSPDVISSDDFVIDIGGEYDEASNRFDHHQWREDADVCHPEGPRMASFGLVWEKHGVEWLAAYMPAFSFSPDPRVLNMAHEYVRKDLVLGIDAFDNGGDGRSSKEQPMGITEIISSMNPTKDVDGAERYSHFMLAVDMAMGVLLAVARTGMRRSENFLKLDSLLIDDIVISDEYILGWNTYLAPTEALFFVHPSLRGGWSAVCVPPKDNLRNKKVPFPREWRGRTGADLEGVSGIKGLTFCHVNRFIVATDTKETAIKAARYAIDHYSSKSE